MSKQFVVPEILAPFLEIVDEVKCRLNFTVDRIQMVAAIKGQPDVEVDVARIGTLALIVGLFTSGIVKILSGAPSRESVTQTDWPKGWDRSDDRITQKVNKKGDKTTYSRPLNAEEKLEAAIAHVAFKLDVLYGVAELQSRTANAHPLGEELRLVLVNAIVASGMADSAGVKYTPKTLPSIFAKTASTLIGIEAAATALGIGANMMERLTARAQENLDRKNLDGILDGMDMSL